MKLQIDKDDLIKAARIWLAGQGVPGKVLDSAEYRLCYNNKTRSARLTVIMDDEDAYHLPDLRLPLTAHRSPGLHSVIDDAAGDVELAERR